MSSALFVLWIVVGAIGIGCAVAAAVIARKQIRAALVLNAVFILLMGASTEIRILGDRIDPSRDAAAANAIATKNISIARGASSPEVRREALKTAEEALSLDTAKAASTNVRVSLSEILALVWIALGSVHLTLALTRPDILSTRVKRETVKNSALVAATGVDL